MGQLRFKQLHPRAWLNHTQFTLAAFALTVLSVTSVLLPAQPVQAQEAAVLEEIVVTARKRAESLQETPVVVNVLTGEMLKHHSMGGLKDLGTIVPGLVTAEVDSSTSGFIFLRGVGTGNLSPLFDQAVSINLDGVGISSAALMNTGMFDLDRIEVLRGPQALFYGKNSPGGVVAIHTKDPTDEFELELSAEYEIEGKEPVLRAVVSGPLGDTLGGRLSVGWSHANNILFDVQNADVFEPGPGGVPVQTAVGTSKHPMQVEQIYAMGTLLWEPTDSFSATLKIAYLDDKQDGHTNWFFQRTQCPYGAPQAIYPVPGVDNCRKDGNMQGGGVNPALAAPDPNFPDATGDGFSNNEEEFASLEINYAISDTLDLTSVTGYYDNRKDQWGDASFQVASVLFNSTFAGIEQLSQEFRLNSNFDGAFNFNLGAYYEDKKRSRQNAVTLGSTVAGLPTAVFGLFGIPIGQQFAEQDSTAYSVFAQMNWELAEQWTLAAGARYSYEEKEAELGVNYFAPAPNGGPILDVPLLEPNPDWNNVSPEATLSYQYDDDVMFFASYKTGFKSGGFDAAWKPSALLQSNVLVGMPYDNIYDEEEADGFEVGMKSTLLDGTLRFNATLYSYEYDGLQLSRLTAGEGGVPSIRVTNAASATVEGLELETLWLTPVDGLALTASLALNNAEYDDFISDCYTGQTIALGCDRNPHPVTGNFTGADMSGESLWNASDVSATFALDYTVAVDSGWNLGFNVTSSYKSEYNVTPSLFPESWWQDSLWLTNASVTLYSSDDTWEFFVRGINLGDEYYSAAGAATPFTGNNALTGTNDPSGLPDFFESVKGGRQVVLGMTYRM